MTIKVKSLEWENHQAQTAIGLRYSVFEAPYKDGDFWVCNLIDGRFSSEQDARDAAQEDYSRRVLGELIVEDMPQTPWPTETICRLIHEVAGTKDADDPLHHPAQKSWEEPSRKRWEQWIELSDMIELTISNMDAYPEPFEEYERILVDLVEAAVSLSDFTTSISKLNDRGWKLSDEVVRLHNEFQEAKADKEFRLEEFDEIIRSRLQNEAMSGVLASIIGRIQHTNAKLAAVVEGLEDISISLKRQGEFSLAKHIDEQFDMVAEVITEKNEIVSLNTEEKS